MFGLAIGCLLSGAAGLVVLLIIGGAELRRDEVEDAHARDWHERHLV